MCSKLTRGELRIIEKTKEEGRKFHQVEKKENQAFHTSNPETNPNQHKEKNKFKYGSLIKSMVYFSLIFLFLAFLLKLFITYITPR